MMIDLRIRSNGGRSCSLTGKGIIGVKGEAKA